MNVLSIRIVDGPEKAPNYKGGDFTPADLKEAVIVCNGTTAGNPTVDLVFEVKDKDGKVTGLAVAMVTGALMQQLAGAITGASKR